jgi:hypothetical protein
MKILDTMQMLDERLLGGVETKEDVNKLEVSENKEDNNKTKTIPTFTSIRTNTPRTTVTETEKRYAEDADFNTWSEMNGYEPWSEFAKRMGIKEPEKPVLDPNRQRQLAVSAMLNDSGRALATLAEAFGLSRGSSVRKHEYGKSPFLSEMERERKEYENNTEKYSTQLQNYYKLAANYEIARQKAYRDSLKSEEIKTVTKTTEGGDYEINKSVNEDYLDRQQQGKERLSRLNASLRASKRQGNNAGDDNWWEYEIGDSGESYQYWYDRKTDDKNLRSAANYLFTKVKALRVDKSILNADAERRIRLAIKKNSLYDREGWTDADNITFLTATVGELLHIHRQLDAEYEQCSEGDIAQSQSIDQKMLKIEEILKQVRKSGFNFK